MERTQNLLIAANNIGFFPGQLLSLEVPFCSALKTMFGIASFEIDANVACPEKIILSQIQPQLKMRSKNVSHTYNIGCLATVLKVKMSQPAKVILMTLKVEDVVEIQSSPQPEHFGRVNWNYFRLNSECFPQEKNLRQKLNTYFLDVAKTMNLIAKLLPEIRDGLLNWLEIWKQAVDFSKKSQELHIMSSQLERFVYESMSWFPLGANKCQEIIECKKIADKMSYLREGLNNYVNIVQFTSANTPLHQLLPFLSFSEERNTVKSAKSLKFSSERYLN